MIPQVHSRRAWFRPAVCACVVIATAFAQGCGAAEPEPPTPPAESARRFPVVVDAAAGEFSLIVVPDTQRYSLYFPDIFHRQFSWIRENHVALNTRFVMHVGDIVEQGADSEWTVADRAFRLLDGEVPYLAVAGNHDLEKDSQGKLMRSGARYNAVFSPKRFAGYPWYGGHKGVSSDNSFAYFDAGGRQFMVLGLEYGPTDETLDWAREMVSNHEDNHMVIVVTHSYMYDDDTRLGDGDRYSPRNANPGWNDGDQMWEKFIRKTKNVVMVLSGHVKGDGTGKLVSTTDEGTPVLQILANYQFLGHGGQGWLRILKFQPAEKRLEVYTYSPWLDRSRDEPDQRFTVDVPWMFP